MVWSKYCGTTGKPGGKQRKQTSTYSPRKDSVYSPNTSRTASLPNYQNRPQKDRHCALHPLPDTLPARAKASISPSQGFIIAFQVWPYQSETLQMGDPGYTVSTPDTEPKNRLCAAWIARYQQRGNTVQRGRITRNNGVVYPLHYGNRRV